MFCWFGDLSDGEMHNYFVQFSPGRALALGSCGEDGAEESAPTRLGPQDRVQKVMVFDSDQTFSPPGDRQPRLNQDQVWSIIQEKTDLEGTLEAEGRTAEVRFGLYTSQNMPTPPTPRPDGTPWPPLRDLPVWIVLVRDVGFVPSRSATDTTPVVPSRADMIYLVDDETGMLMTSTAVPAEGESHDLA